MIIVTGLLVTALTWSRIGLPYPGYFVSTRTTPVSVIKTVVLPLTLPACAPGPRPPVIMYSASLTFSSRMALGSCCARAMAIDTAPMAIRTVSTTSRLMRAPPLVSPTVAAVYDRLFPGKTGRLLKSGRNQAGDFYVPKQDVCGELVYA